MDAKLQGAYEQVISRSWGIIPPTPAYESHVKQLIPKLIEELKINAHLGVAEKLDHLLELLHEGVRNSNNTFDQNLKELNVLCRASTQNLNTHAMRDAILVIVVGSPQGAGSCADMIAKIKAEDKKDNMQKPSKSRSRSDSGHSLSPSSHHRLGQQSETVAEQITELEQLYEQLAQKYDPYIQVESNDYWAELKTILQTPFVTAVRLARNDQLPEDYLNFLKAQAEYGIVDASGHSKASDTLPPGPERGKSEHIAQLFKHALNMAEKEMHYAKLEETEKHQKLQEHNMKQVQLELEEENEGEDKTPPRRRWKFWK
jgi:hypothetical protein